MPRAHYREHRAPPRSRGAGRAASSWRAPLPTPSEETFVDSDSANLDEQGCQSIEHKTVNAMPPRRSRASAAAALAACFVLFSSLISSSVAEHIEFDVWHRLGSDASSKWTPAGTLSGEVDTEALVDAAAAALRGGGGRIPPPPKSSSPVLTLYRDEKNAITFEEAKRAADRGQGYSIKLKRKLADDRSKKNKKATTKGSTLFTSAPPHCAAAALSGALPLKLDGSLPKSSSGGAGIRVTGVSFDFYGGACSKGNYKRGTKQQQQQLQAQQQQQQQRVPLWLPAAAPPLLPPLVPRASRLLLRRSARPLRGARPWPSCPPRTGATGEEERPRRRRPESGCFRANSPSRPGTAAAGTRAPPRLLLQLPPRLLEATLRDTIS